MATKEANFAFEGGAWGLSSNFPEFFLFDLIFLCLFIDSYCVNESFRVCIDCDT